ncbi:alpha/beta hydrolase [Nonomuraea sp. PA05]|uniref:alpha/beta fold hydrolase n=1 Tax=Nonomuraea sp. PA05 TaxID=2604466 RepID=UPI0011DC0245|nr:alpha/beta fold hydrolase [Nonomuraea sp. PA05]TYB69263.1 alpha/beta hydrolase [Nonomuraea sp. PA05]
MTTFVLIPGMCHGGWCFSELTEELRSHGHRAHPMTLTGLSERSHLPHAGVNLDTHIQDVTGVLAAEQLQDVVLVGHSYGGMVITGAADRMPERVRSLVYLDAVVPGDGESMWDLVSDRERQWYAETGDAVRPLPFFDPRATPHPLASLLQPLRLTGGAARDRRDVYVYAAGWPTPSPFTATYQRLIQDPRWITHALDSGHNLMRDAPQDLLKILLATG